MNFNEYVRKARMDELNKILPMIQQTLQRRKRFYQISKEAEDVREELKTTKENKRNVEGVLTISLSEDIKVALQDISRKLYEKEDYLSKKFKKANKEREYLDKTFYFDMEFFTYSCETICYDGYQPFLLPEEIKAEYLNEYVYLIAIMTYSKGTLNSRLNLQTFLNNKSRKYLKELLIIRYGQDTANSIWNCMQYNSEQKEDRMKSLVTQYLK